MTSGMAIAVLLFGLVMLIGGFFLGRADEAERRERDDQNHTEEGRGS